MLDVEDNVYVVCHSVKSLQKLDAFQDKNIIVISDDTIVHESCKNFAKVSCCVFLTKAIPYTRVAKNVRHAIDKVNNYFDEVAKVLLFNSDIMHWSYHVEGGETTQAIQDLFIFIESAYLTINTLNIQNIYFLEPPRTTPEEILFDVAKQLKIRVKVLNKSMFILSTFPLAPLKRILRVAYLPLVTLLIKLKLDIQGFNNKWKNLDNVILFQLCGNARRHIDAAQLPQKEFIDKGYTTITAGWRNLKGLRVMEREGYLIVPLENFVKYKDILNSALEAIRIFFQRKGLIQLFLSRSSFFYDNIDASKHIAPYVIRYLYAEVPDNYRLNIAANNINFVRNVKAVKYCAAYHVKKGTILADALGRDLLSFNYSVGVMVPNVYRRYIFKKNKEFFKKNHIEFVLNNIEKKQYQSESNVKNNLVVPIGGGRFQKHFDNIDLFDKDTALRALGIPNNYSYYIMADYPIQRNGEQSLEETHNRLELLTTFVSARDDIALLIKPHPAVDAKIVSKIANKENVFLINKSVNSLEYALTVSDVLVCKFTTIGLESMIYDTQVISCIFDGESDFEIFGNSAEYIYSIKKLNSLFEKIFSNKDAFDNWKDSYKERRNLFVKEYYMQGKYSSSCVIVKNVEKEIARKYEKL